MAEPSSTDFAPRTGVTCSALFGGFRATELEILAYNYGWRSFFIDLVIALFNLFLRQEVRRTYDVDASMLLQY
jgi:hypothetical protein